MENINDDGCHPEYEIGIAVEKYIVVDSASLLGGRQVRRHQVQGSVLTVHPLHLQDRGHLNTSKQAVTIGKALDSTYGSE